MKPEDTTQLRRLFGDAMPADGGFSRLVVARIARAERRRQGLMALALLGGLAVLLPMAGALAAAMDAPLHALALALHEGAAWMAMALQQGAQRLAAGGAVMLALPALALLAAGALFLWCDEAL